MDRDKQTPDHDLLIEMKSDVKSILSQMEKINGAVSEHESRLRQVEVSHSSCSTKIEALERRPSASKAVYMMTALLGALQTGLYFLMSQ